MKHVETIRSVVFIHRRDKTPVFGKGINTIPDQRGKRGGGNQKKGEKDIRLRFILLPI